MTRTCIVNVNNMGEVLAEYLKTEGRIEGWEYGGNARICLEFNGTLTITFDDYIEVHPHKDLVERFEPRLEREQHAFNKWIQTEMIKTLRGGEVVEYIPGERITIKSTERTETICVRVTPEEKKMLEEEARKLNLTLSEYIRTRLLD